MPFRDLMRREGDRPGLPVRDVGIPVAMLPIAAGLALAGTGLLVAAIVVWWRRR